MFEYQETPPGTLHHYSLNELRLDDIAGKGPISIQGDGVPELGELRVNAQLRGDYDAPRLDDINANLQRGKEVDLIVRGSVENIYSGAGMLLHIDGRSTQSDVAS